jgi:hypothetical protein
MDDHTFKTLRQIRETRESVVVKREAVAPLIADGLVDEIDEAFFLTERGGEALEAEINRRKGGPPQDEFHSPEDDH